MTNNYFNTIYTTILQASVGNIISLLNNFAGDPLFSEKFALVFGTTVSSEQFLQAVTTLPEVEIRSDADLAGALGAFSGQTQKVYLSESLVKGDSSQLEAVLLEEFGHYFDFRFNTTDTPGDEGELFSDVVRGVHLSNPELKRIQNEDDHAVISIDGQLISVEEAFGPNGIVQIGTPGNYDEYINGISTDSSGNIFVAGNSPRLNSGALIIKLDATGNKLLDKTLSLSSKSIAANGVSTDSNGNISVTGFISGGASNNDTFVIKLSASGSQLWLQQFNFLDDDRANGITTDSSDNIYISGETSGSLFGNSNVGGIDCYVAKYDVNGSQLWVKQFGTSSEDHSTGVNAEKSGNVYVTGYSSGSLPGNSNLGSNDAFVVKYDGSGNQIWVKQFGTSGEDRANGVVTDSTGNVYITGYTKGSLSGNNNLGANDAFIAKYNATGTQLWIKQFGTSSDDYAKGISIDASGNTYVTGYSNGSLFGNKNLGGNDAFAAKYDANGNQLWIKQFGTSSDDYSNGISADNRGNVYFGGYTNGNLLPDTSLSGKPDAFIIGVNSENGNRLTNTPLKDKLTTPIIRFQNTDKPGTYLFAGEQEAASIRQNYKGFKEEGIAFQVAVSKDDPLMQPFYRFRNTQKGREGTYLFAGQQEATSIRTKYKNFVEEGLAFYAYSAGVGGGTTDFARFQNKNTLGTYLFTGPSETTSVMNNSGFTLEGSAFAAAG
jgi:hypothetical protein